MALDSSQAVISQRHPIYQRWHDTWRLLGEAYRGDAGFLDGSHLVPHPRELTYKLDAERNPTSEIAGETASYVLRKRLARYENFFRTIVSTYIGHLWAKTVTRSVGPPAGGTAAIQSPLAAWWDNCDGRGTHMSDFMQTAQTLALRDGFCWVLLDREVKDPNAILTKADQPGIVLRLYGALDGYDWIFEDGELQAVKFIEPLVRENLNQRIPLANISGVEIGAAVGDGAPRAVQYRVWDRERWTLFDQAGTKQSEGEHQMGRCPVTVLRCWAVGGLPVFGLGLGGDGKLFKDHYNLLSEARAIERGQTFSMLHVQLGQDETRDDAQSNLGGAAAINNVMMTRGTAQFLAPPSGPLDALLKDIETIERKMYRLAGLPWEGDARGVESADSRRLKAMDLNRLLASLADEAEHVEYALARLWFAATSGPDQGEAAFEDAAVTIRYPDEFYTLDTSAAMQEVADVDAMMLGPAAKAEIRRRMVDVALPDLAPDLRATIEDEIAHAPQQPAQAGAVFRARLSAALPGGAGTPGQPGAAQAGTPDAEAAAATAEMQKANSLRTVQPADEMAGMGQV